MTPAFILNCGQTAKVTRLGKPAVHGKHQRTEQSDLGSASLRDWSQAFEKDFN